MTAKVEAKVERDMDGYRQWLDELVYAIRIREAERRRARAEAISTPSAAWNDWPS